MLSKLTNYLFQTSSKYEIIELYPSIDFLYGKVYISILRDVNGYEYVISKNAVIKKIHYVDLSVNNIYSKFNLNKVNVICENFPLLTNFDFGENNYETELDIHLSNDMYIIMSLTNSKTKLPLEKCFNKFKFILTIDKSKIVEELENGINRQLNDKYISAQIYKNVIDIENKIISSEKQIKNIGICFSGGGARSFAATLGYIRALKSMNLLNKIKYVSCVSGSSWAWVPFTYLNNDGKIDEDIFIGLAKFRYSNNGNGDIGRKMGKRDYDYTHKKYLADGLINLAYNFQLIEYIYDSFRYLSVNEKSRVWAYLIGCIFLKPFGLMDKNFISYNQNTIDLYNVYNGDIKSKFALPYNDERPYLIVNANIVNPKKSGTLTNTDFNIISMTPFISGCPNIIECNDGKKYGGSMINTYAFHGLKIMKNYVGENDSNGVDNVLIQIHNDDKINDIKRFNLFDMMGASSTAYGIIAEYVGLTSVNPSYRLNDSENKIMKSFDLIDGGVLDNMGILPLLQRKTTNIISFINSCSEIKIDADDNIMTQSIDISLRQLFLGDANVDKIKYLHYFEYINNLQIFDTELWSKNVLPQLRKNIAENGVAVIELNDIWTIENKSFDITQYKIDKLLIIYLNKNQSWIDGRLGNDVKLPTNFPYYDTIFQTTGYIQRELLHLDAAEVNLLADMCHWNLECDKFINAKLKMIFD